MNAEAVITAYYDALRRGDPIHPYFLEDDSTVKIGVRGASYGYENVADSLREQSRTTEDWTVESHRLTVEEADDHARFADEVTLAWTDLEAETRHRFETRWTGTLVRQNGEWRFATMHVSAPHELR
ncbi:nuclear transport factor 2 family protein [Natronobeatus ordinarius]|uniref:nuclear transport factor 2 family protein n=1 Tax=Natronobeatus ordinarius TaxID=2963433 RepID=UPI0020CD9165|nr:nuclear transport factor 2 family protein [Natronobeatus ordinarius]